MVSKIILAALAATVAHTHGVIKSVSRQVMMLEPDVTIYTNDIKFEPSDTKGAIKFEYLVAADFEQNLVELECHDLNYYEN